MNFMKGFLSTNVGHDTKILFVGYDKKETSTINKLAAFIGINAGFLISSLQL